MKGYSYGRSDVTAKGLANAYSQTLGQIFSHEVKPYEVEVIVAEVGPTSEETQLYRIQFDGTLLAAQRYAAIGGKDDELAEKLEEGYEVGLALPGAIAASAAAIEAVEDRQIDADEWEAAVLDRSLDRRIFRRLEPTEIADARTA